MEYKGVSSREKLCGGVYNQNIYNKYLCLSLLTTITKLKKEGQKIIFFSFILLKTSYVVYQYFHVSVAVVVVVECLGGLVVVVECLDALVVVVEYSADFYHGPDVSLAMVIRPPVGRWLNHNFIEQTSTNMSARSATGVE